MEIRAFLERARPIDKRLRYQMDKLLAAAAAVQVHSRHTACAFDISLLLANMISASSARPLWMHTLTHSDLLGCGKGWVAR